MLEKFVYPSKIKMSVFSADTSLLLSRIKFHVERAN